MIIIDSNHLLNRIVHMNLNNIKENPSFLAHTFFTSVLSISKKFKASRHNPVVLAIDSHSWRKDFFEENKSKFKEYKNISYKGNREKSTDIPWDEIYKIFYDICESLKVNSDFFVCKINKAEADDIIAILTKHTKKTNNVIIISSDKDFVQLQDKNVRIYDPILHEYKKNIDINIFKKIHCMIGDKCDNIPSIKTRLGEKTAEKMLPILDELLQTNIEMKTKYEFNQHLIDFDFIPKEIEQDILEDFKTQSFNYNSINLMQTFSKYRLNKVIENINGFKFNDVIIESSSQSFFE